MENELYRQCLDQKEKEFESICGNCGECCGAKDDMCVNLMKTAEDTYICMYYDNRIGPQSTVSGKIFHCVSIREHISEQTLPPNCKYR